jgi:hypothetical protein
MLKNYSTQISKPGAPANYYTDDPSRRELLDDMQREARLLDMINKVQMFQIAGDKVNKSLQQRKLSPVFTLKIHEG